MSDNIRKGDDYQNAGQDHPTWGIHVGDHHNKIEVYGKDAEPLRDNILSLLNTPAPVSHLRGDTIRPKVHPLDPALIGVAEEVKESGGHWQPCTGCYDTEDGHPTQKYAFSPALQTSIGCGCHECGGLGAVWWHMTDEEVEDFARACEEVDIEHERTIRISRLEFALRGLSKAYADCNGEDHPAYEEAQRLLAGSPPPETREVGNATPKE